MLGEQSLGPQFVGVTHVLRPLTSTVQHPGRRLVTEAARPASSGQLTQAAFQPKRKHLLTHNTTVLRFTP
jgi:hypothetical protein